MFPKPQIWLALLGCVSLAFAADNLNKPDRLEWFRDQGFGMFIHWSLDSQLGVVISHSLAGASEDYKNRFFNDLPKTFNPKQFDPSELASLAKLAGVRYVVFTTKHHSGFCMWDTKTTGFSVMHTPYHRDVFADVVKAFRDQEIAPGVYFSPDDFHWLWQNGKPIDRHRPELDPPANPGLLALDQAQVTELLTNYGPQSAIFFDGAPEGLRELAWKLQPDIVVTRGAMTTPEQYLPGVPLEGAWEGNMTMGTAWQYQPQNDIYKSGRKLISLLIETRAKGGNMLLNVGPKPNGELPIEQEERLRELALWMFVNGESIYAVRPWVITNEENIWFTKKKDANTLYAAVEDLSPRGEWRDVVLHSVKASPQTTVGILGQDDQILEYRHDVIPKTTWNQQPDGLHIRYMRAQRLQDNSKWPNPVVLKVTDAQPALKPPIVETTNALRQGDTVVLNANLRDLGDAKSVQIGFEYRSLKGLDVNERSGDWQSTPFQPVGDARPFSADVGGWARGEPYEYRAVVKHPLLTMYGEAKKVTLQ